MPTILFLFQGVQRFMFLWLSFVVYSNYFDFMGVKRMESNVTLCNGLHMERHIMPAFLGLS